MQKTIILFQLLIFLASCQPAKKTAVSTAGIDAGDEKKIPVQPVYMASNTITNDLVHTRLEVRFDWEKKQLMGKATITLTPHFYPAAFLYLNARGMDLHEISLQTTSGRQPLKYIYDHDSITITLDRIYKKGEQYQVYIDYTARPEELKEGGSAAITSDKGLYFINADGKEKDKPRQIWTQGETQSSSAWFPTIDSPNERMTQEIYITIDSAFTTLSNGLLISSVKNNDGTRTDYWKQSLPAAPYLTMMAIGQFAVVKDKWRSIAVNYYLEPAYESYARLIFGHTPEMLEFFSTRLGVDYPWEKFSQVVVSDYVSGAMENTTAVVHGDYLQQDSREYLDNSYEDVISHELFHHWFGDLVTCESWANVPLNESFATYGQYLWSEYKYGRDEADYGIQQDLAEYLSLGRGKGPNLIRFDYINKEDMFDVVSYQKGGRILHMLRKVVGDDAFFASLKLYLLTNKFKPVEAHQLRLAFEETTGRDLNWFFNEWFFSGGHPELKITYAWNDSLKKQTIYVEQTQNFENAPLYQMPVDVDFYCNNHIIRRNAWMSQVKDTFSFDLPDKPFLVNFDAEKMLVAVKNDAHTIPEWMYMYNHAPLYLDRYEALNKLSKNYTAESEQAPVIQNALHDSYWNIRALAIKNIGTLASSEKYKAEIKSKLISLAEKDPKSSVRSAALKSLAKYYHNGQLEEVYKKATGDSSYEVMGDAIRNYVDLDPKAGMQWLKQFENTDNKRVASVIAGIYAENGSDENNEFLLKTIANASTYRTYQLVSDYAKFLSRCKPATVEEGIPVIEHIARNGQAWWVRMSGTQALADLAKTCEEKSDALKLDITDATQSNKPAIVIQELEARKKKYLELKDLIEQKMKDIKKNETDKNLIKIYGGTGD